MTHSILVVAPEPAATAIAHALRDNLGTIVELASYRRSTHFTLRRDSFSLILLDENLAAADPEATQTLYADAGTAPVVEMNLAVCGMDRVLRQVRSTLSRRALDEAKARDAAAAAINHELNASLTGLLLKSQLALRHAGPELAPTLQELVDLAAEIRAQLRPA